MDIAALIIAALALAISAAAAWYSHRQAKAADRQAKAAERLTDIESDRHTHEVNERERVRLEDATAALTVRFAAREGNSSTKLRISNDGRATATGISIAHLECLDGGTGPLRAWEPPETLTGGDSCEFPARFSAQSGRRHRVELRWTDGRGHHAEEFTVGLY